VEWEGYKEVKEEEDEDDDEENVEQRDEDQDNESASLRPVIKRPKGVEEGKTARSPIKRLVEARV